MNAHADLRRTAAWALVLGAIACVLCMVPLFDLLAYEFCFALAIAASFAGAHVGAAAFGSRPLTRFFRAVVEAIIVLSIPFAVITANRVRVQNCNYSAGVHWFLWLPVASVVIACALGVTARAVAERPRRATALAVFAVLMSFAWAAYRFYASPTVFAFDPFGGYFPGSLYDEDIAIPRALYYARAEHLCFAIAALGVCDAWRSRGRRWFRLLALLLSAPVCALGIWLFFTHARHGVYLTATDVAYSLGAEKKSEHFVLHYSPRGPYAAAIDRFVDDHEFRYSQLATTLGVSPRRPIHSYLFDSPAHKRALMGAANVYIAKPWRREIYLHFDAWPHNVVKHELAHVFAAEFGDSFLGLSLDGVLPNIGLIEGIAVAADWHGNPLTPHQSVLALVRAGLKPDPAPLLSPRFFGVNAEQAYAVAGSFVRFLLERYGPERLGRAFRDAAGPERLAKIYDKPFAKLVEEWLVVVSEQTLPEQSGAQAAARMRRPSVFARRCAHDRVLRYGQADALFSRGDTAGALKLLREMCSELPDDPDPLVAILGITGRARDLAELERTAKLLLEHRGASLPQRARAETALGDLALVRGDTRKALAQYQLVETLPYDDNAIRLVTAKRLAASEPDPELRDHLGDFLVQDSIGKRDPARDLELTRRLTEDEPDRGFFHYLYARQLDQQGRRAEAATELERAIALTLPDPRFTVEAHRMLGVTLFSLARYTDAGKQFEILQRKAHTEALRLVAQDWMERIEWTNRRARN